MKDKRQRLAMSWPYWDSAILTPFLQPPPRHPATSVPFYPSAVYPLYPATLNPLQPLVSSSLSSTASTRLRSHLNSDHLTSTNTLSGLAGGSKSIIKPTTIPIATAHVSPDSQPSVLMSKASNKSSNFSISRLAGVDNIKSDLNPEISSHMHQSDHLCHTSVHIDTSSLQQTNPSASQVPPFCSSCSTPSYLRPSRCPLYLPYALHPSSPCRPLFVPAISAAHGDSSYAQNIHDSKLPDHALAVKGTSGSINKPTETNEELRNQRLVPHEFEPKIIIIPNKDPIIISYKNSETTSDSSGRTTEGEESSSVQKGKSLENHSSLSIQNLEPTCNAESASILFKSKNTIKRGINSNDLHCSSPTIVVDYDEPSSSLDL